MSNEPDKVNSGALATMIVLVAFSTLAVALVVTALVRQETARLESEGDQNQERPFRQLRSEQETKLNDAPAWADQTAGLATIPINSAMQLVLEEVRENPLAMSPGNKPEEEEEEEATEDAEEATEEEASEDAGAATDVGEESEAEEASAPKKPVPASASKIAPAPAPKVAPAPRAPAAPAPAPKAPATPTPAPGGPGQ